jgi:NAD(P)-dependent dehydrogenase (short-subunit alcohol dehydrogenase family)
MITGSNSGIGYETALWLAQRGGTVHLVCRNKERGQKALDDIKEQSKNEKVYLHVCDVSVMSDIRKVLTVYESILLTAMKMVSEFVKEGHRLDVLVSVHFVFDFNEITPFKLLRNN